MRKIILISAMVLCAMLATSCDEFENSWEGNQKGIITVINNSSDFLYPIKIWKYSDGSGDKIEDYSSSLSIGSSRTYQNETVLNIEWEAYFKGANKRRLITISTFTPKWIYLSAGQNVEIIVTDSGLIVDSIYEAK